MRLQDTSLFLALSLLMTLTATASANSDEYVCPYRITFSAPIEALRSIDREPPRDNTKQESPSPYDEWYTKRIRRRYGAWGPEARHYPPIPGFERLPADWKEQRLLAVAFNMIGLPYQHHHIPDWDPPRDWPWKHVAYGRNSKGLDCSNFTAWVYNYGLGIRISSAIHAQAKRTSLSGPGGDGFVEARVIRDDNGYEDLVSRLEPGDLLYIKHKGSDDVSHVVMWVGKYGRAPDNTPLIIDCTGPEHQDCNGNNIPIGVQLRPFTRNSWYYNSFSHAHRIIGEPEVSSN